MTMPIHSRIALTVLLFAVPLFGVAALMCRRYPAPMTKLDWAGAAAGVLIIITVLVEALCAIWGAP